MQDRKKLIQYIKEITDFADKNGIPCRPAPKLSFSKDDESQNIFGKTAYYTPNDQKIVLFDKGRAGKDVLRSYVHELVHHSQNLRGDLSEEKIGKTTDSITNGNDHLNEMEKEAYLKSNMVFRSWTESKK